MRTGFAISITMHVLAILAGLFLVPYKEDRLRDVNQTLSVSLVEAPAVPAERDQAPDIQDVAVPPIAAPSFEVDAGPAPEEDIAPTETSQDIIEDPSAQDAAADLSALTEELVQPEVAVAVTAPEESAPEPSMPSMALPGTSGFDNRTESPRGPSMNSPLSPPDAPRISTFSAPPPPKPARPAETETAAVTETPAPVEQTPPKEQEVPQESTTAVSPSPESGAEEGLALRRSTAPRARPQNFEAQIAEAVAEAAAEELARAEAAARAAEAEKARQAEAEKARQAEAEAQAQATAKQREQAQIEAAAAAAVAERPADVPVGPPLSAGEKDGLRVAVQKCWRIPSGLEGDTELRVVISVELDPNGRVVGSPQLLEPASASTPELRAAFEAARRAVLRCQGGSGYDLPREKFAQWQNLEIGFTPKGMLERW